MEIIILEIILLILCFLGLLAVVIFFRRKYNYNSVDLLIRRLDEQKELDLLTLESGNREINRIEKEILECKKKLKIKLFNK